MTPVSRSDLAAVNLLKGVDWDFHGAKTGYLTHGLHPYPAKFIPHIPRALIQSLSRPGDVVADVFCGSGTSLIEAMLLGRNVIGVDASELACLITTAKTARLNDSELKILEALESRVQVLGADFSEGNSTLFKPRIDATKHDIPAHDAIDFWFEQHVSQELAALLALIRELPGEAQLVAKVSLSSIVVNVSRQDSDTRYVRREKFIRPGETCRRFVRALREARFAIGDFTRPVDPALRRKVIHADVLSAPDIGQVDLVVSSPPYPNAYSYHLYHMTRMVWLGMDQPEFKAREIGSHRKYSRVGPNGATADTFKSELGKIFSWLSSHVRSKGFACFVIGDSIIKGERVRNDELLTEAAIHNGFALVDRISRRLQDTKKAFNPKIGKIKREHIVILQRT